MTKIWYEQAKDEWKEITFTPIDGEAIKKPLLGPITSVLDLTYADWSWLNPFYSWRPWMVKVLLAAALLALTLVLGV